MQYGRTVLELLMSQAVVLGGLLVTPFEPHDAMGRAIAAVSVTLSAVLASLVYTRHRQRNAEALAFRRKLERLRHLNLT